MVIVQKHMNQGYTKSHTTEIPKADGGTKIVMNTKWTQKGRLFIYELLKRRILPSNGFRGNWLERSFSMTDIAEITQRDREKIKEYVESSKFLTYTMLAEDLELAKSYLSLILNGKKTSAEANRIIDSIITMYNCKGRNS